MQISVNHIGSSKIQKYFMVFGVDLSTITGKRFHMKVIHYSIIQIIYLWQGYGIVKRWRDKLFVNTEVSMLMKQEMKARSPSDLESDLQKLSMTDDLPYPGSFFIYTSNVDAHSHKIGFPPYEIHEIHGYMRKYHMK